MNHMKDIFEIFVEQYNCFPKYENFHIKKENGRIVAEIIPIPYGQQTTWHMTPENKDEYKEIINIFIDQVIATKGYNCYTKTIIYNPKTHICKAFGLIAKTENGKFDIFYQFSDPNFQHILVS